MTQRLQEGFSKKGKEKNIYENSKSIIFRIVVIYREKTASSFIFEGKFQRSKKAKAGSS